MARSSGSRFSNVVRAHEVPASGSSGGSDGVSTAELNAAIAAHAGAANPHGVYLTQAEGDARYLTEASADAAYLAIDGTADDSNLLNSLAGSYYLDYTNFTNTPSILNTENVQDIVGAMVSGNTETGISVVYQDADGTLDFVLTDGGAAAVSSHESSYDHSSYLTETAADALYLGLTAEASDSALLNAQAPSYYLDYTNFSNTPTILDNENVQDIAGGMFSGNTEDGVSVVYQDADGTLDVTNTDKGSTAVTGHESTYDHASYLTETSADALYLGLTDEATDSALLNGQAGSYYLAYANLTGAPTVLDDEGIQDLIGAMVTGNTETGITVSYQDSDGTLDFVLTDGGTAAVSAHNSAYDHDEFVTNASADAAYLAIDGTADNADLLNGQAASYYLDYTNFNNTPTIPNTEAIQDIVGAMASGNTETGITVTYQDDDGTLDFELTDGGAAAVAAHESTYDHDNFLTEAAADSLFLTPTEGDAAYLAVDGTADDSDLLGGQNSGYHLSRTNHTGTQALSTISDAGGAAAAGVKNSIEIDSGDIQLDGDEASPGNNKVYGTDGSGTKGWKDDPSGGGAANAAQFYVGTGGTVVAENQTPTVLPLDSTAVNNTSGVVSLSSSEVTVTEDAVYLVTFAVAMEIDFLGASGTARAFVKGRLQVDTGSGYTDVPGSLVYDYLRCTQNSSVKAQGGLSGSALVSVSSGDKLRVLVNQSAEAATGGNVADCLILADSGMGLFAI